MLVGHINLAASMNGIGEHFIRLVEALDRQNIEQHVLVANQSLAKRICVYERVIVGPVVKTPVLAYCLMPDVRVVHAHDSSGGQAGLLMTLTRSTPYILSRRSTQPIGRNPIVRAMIRRAAGIVCPTEAAAKIVMREDFGNPVEIIEDLAHETVEGDVTDNHAAAEHLRIYRRAVDSRRIPALLL
ncbi:MAG: glycosyltransferase [Woeseiaceae bacterium]|nr:glycosyltransferase [Woeseiaceae bacterium]